MTKKLRRCRVYSVDDGDGHSDQMDEYSERGEYYYAADVDTEIVRLQAEIRALDQANGQAVRENERLRKIITGCPVCSELERNIEPSAFEQSSPRAYVERWDAGCDSRPLLQEADKEVDRLERRNDLVWQVLQDLYRVVPEQYVDEALRSRVEPLLIAYGTAPEPGAAHIDEWNENAADGELILKPCPFCDSEAKIENAAEVGPNSYVVCCQNPMCMSSSKVIVAEKDNITRLLIEAWNRRGDKIRAQYAESAEKSGEGQ